MGDDDGIFIVWLMVFSSTQRLSCLFQCVRWPWQTVVGHVLWHIDSLRSGWERERKVETIVEPKDVTSEAEYLSRSFFYINYSLDFALSNDGRENN